MSPKSKQYKPSMCEVVANPAKCRFQVPNSVGVHGRNFSLANAWSDRECLRWRNAFGMVQRLITRLFQRPSPHIGGRPKLGIGGGCSVGAMIVCFADLRKERLLGLGSTKDLEYVGVS